MTGLHHSPFDCYGRFPGTPGTLLLQDKLQLMSILSNRVDCLLFGHTTPDGVPQDSYPEWEKSYGIPLINCENLEDGNDPWLPVSVIDLKQNHVEVYSSYLKNTTPQIQKGYNKIKGEYHIVPTVNEPETLYDYIIFNTGDVVEFTIGGGVQTEKIFLFKRLNSSQVDFTIGGGVQTEGSGKTWKRFVNPSGSNSDRMYYGQIHIPGITKGLTPIRDLVERLKGEFDSMRPDVCRFTAKIPDLSAIPVKERILRLGYVDDNYCDNSYDDHDDGTENQCRNVDQAFVTIYFQNEDVKRWTIQPIVNTGDRICYNGIAGREAIEFRSGDKVTIKAGGGVQTGGSGKTWKRYVNPLDRDANPDRLYYGEIYIPGITASLTPIRDLVRINGVYDYQCRDRGTIEYVIPNIDRLSAQDKCLSLRYVDDDYSNNGYWGHDDDDGTKNQCKNVYAAYVEVTIEREESVQLN